MLSGRAQGTTYQIKYYGEERISKQEIDSILKVIDRSMSLYDANSIICRFNDPNVSEVTMDEHMAKVVQASRKAYQDTRGYFDITVYPLVKIWGFGADGAKNVPSQEAIDSVRQIIGMKKLEVKGDRLSKRVRNVSIDLNGIAQGYSVDVLAAHLRSRGVKDFLVELGGEIRSFGSKPEGPFVVELYRPTHIAKGEMLRVKMSNNAITSSGVYEQQRKVNGKMISHHMNPLTGQPLQSTIVSATVIAKTAMEADALDNYFMSLTPKEAIRFANKRKDVEVYIVCFEDNTFKELQSSGFNNYIY
ncbi:MAG: FAD:protein FMN transferase [Sphingobacterium sp.]|nr:FAD:protein FMN transferase [Sphingobacterium sp.]